MKRLFKKRWARYVAVIILLASVGIIFSPQKSSAVIDDINLTEPANYLKNMGETCYNLKKTGGDLDNSPWATCELQQKLLKERLGCDPHMFYSVDKHPDPDDPSIVDTRWYIIPSKYAACVELAQAKLDYIKAATPCGSMLHKKLPGDDLNSPGWESCNKAQDALNMTLNCSNHMFKERADSEDHWTQVPSALEACDAEIVDARQTKLTDSDGNKAIATEAAPPPADAGGITSSDDGGSGTSCAGGGMGWLFCPMINYLTKTIQIVAGLVDKLMTVKFLSSESGGKSIEGIWRVMLTVANIMLVIAFMFIIFSQSTSAGLSNYGIKRMLPRLVIAAIMMNLSFYICAIAIDFSNIIGGSIMGFLLGSGNSIQSSVTSVTSGTGGSGSSFLGGAVAGIALVGLAFFLFTPIMLGMIAFFVAIVGRQVILLCLVLISPLAFVAWLLPNTEKLFKKWSTLFFELLIMYPAVMLIFGATLLLSNLIGGSTEGINLSGGN